MRIRKQELGDRNIIGEKIEQMFREEISELGGIKKTIDKYLG